MIGVKKNQNVGTALFRAACGAVPDRNENDIRFGDVYFIYFGVSRRCGQINSPFNPRFVIVTRGWPVCTNTSPVIKYLAVHKFQ
jgi:hypothetical protein